MKHFSFIYLVRYPAAIETLRSGGNGCCPNILADPSEMCDVPAVCTGVDGCDFVLDPVVVMGIDDSSIRNIGWKGIGLTFLEIALIRSLACFKL